jgi:hypothetical protein
MKKNIDSQEGFITLIFMLLLILVVVMVFVYLRVQHSQAPQSSVQFTSHRFRFL